MRVSLDSQIPRAPWQAQRWSHTNPGSLGARQKGSGMPLAKCPPQPLKKGYRGCQGGDLPLGFPWGGCSGSGWFVEGFST